MNRSILKIDGQIFWNHGFELRNRDEVLEIESRSNEIVKVINLSYM
jgi:hypothetical protein